MPYLLPAGRVAYAVDTVLTAAEAYQAVAAAQGGDYVPAGRFLVVTYLDEEYPQIPWDLVIP